MKNVELNQPVYRQFLSINLSDKDDWEQFLDRHCHVSFVRYNIPTLRQAKCNSCNLCEPSIFIAEQEIVHSLAKAFLEEQRFTFKDLETMNSKLERLASPKLVWQHTDLSRLLDEELDENTSPDIVSIFKGTETKNLMGEIYLSLFVDIYSTYSPIIPIDKRFLSASKLRTLEKFHWLFLPPLGRPYGSIDQLKDDMARELYQIWQNVKEREKAKGKIRKRRKGRSRYLSIYDEVARLYESEHRLDFKSLSENTVKSLINRGKRIGEQQ